MYSSYSRIPTVQSWTLSGSYLVTHQGEDALRSLRRFGASEAVGELKPLADSGLRSWLITSSEVIGIGTPPDEPLRRAKTTLQHRSRGGLFLGYRVTPVKYGDEEAELLIVLPGLDSPLTVFARLFLLIAIPLCFCYLLARRISLPIERVSEAASVLAEGDLDHRILKLNGPLEVRRLGQSFNDLAQKLEEARAAQARLLADLSHEIRSPLSRLNLASQLAQTAATDPSKYLVQIERDVARLNELVASLSLVTEAKASDTLHEDVNLAEITEDVITAIRIEADAHNIDLQTTFTDAWVVGNRPLIFSAIENVLRNSIKNSPGHSQIEVRVSDAPPLVTVRDHGPGVSTQELEKIFEPFYRCSESRDRDSGGVGLGLAIVKAAMIEHGGQVRADLPENGGLAISLHFRVSNRHLP